MFSRKRMSVSLHYVDCGYRVRSIKETLENNLRLQRLNVTETKYAT